jgi:hypothetical protein
MGKNKNEFNVKEWVDESINDEVDQARIDFDIDEITEADPEEGAKLLLKARSKAVKAFSKELERSLQYLRKAYERELNYSKEDVFPRDWMMRNKGITRIIGDKENGVKAQYPLLIPLLNCLYNLNRGTKAAQLAENMIYNCTEKLMIYGHPFDSHNNPTDDYPLSTFVTNGRLYKTIAKELDCSEISVKKHIRGMLQAGLIYNLGKNGRNGRLLCDGYFAGSYSAKHSSITDCAETRLALQTFKPI